MLVEIVDQNLRISVALEFDDYAGVFVGLVANVADALKNLLVDELGDTLDQLGAVDAERNLRDDDIFTSTLDLLRAHAGSHSHRAAPRLKIGPDTGASLNEAARRKVRTLDVLHQTFNGDVRIVNLSANPIDGLAKIVRWDVGRHADGNPRATVYQQIGERCRKYNGFGEPLVVVGDEIHRILLEIIEKSPAKRSEPSLGVTHGRRGIAFHRTEVALGIHERVPHGPVLRHVDKRRIDHRLAVRMVVARRITANLRALHGLARRIQAQLVHGIQNAPL